MRFLFVAILAGSVCALSAAPPRAASPVRQSGELLNAATPATPKPGSAPHQSAPAVPKPGSAPRQSVPSAPQRPPVTAPAPAGKDVRVQALTGQDPQAKSPRHQALTGHDPSLVDPYRQAREGTAPMQAPGKPPVRGGIRR